MNRCKLIISVGIVTILMISCGKKISGLNWNYLDRNTLEVNEIDFKYFSAKAKMKYKDNKYDVKAKATVRIKKDSAIWMNFSAVGISGGRCMITKDSLTLLNMLKKEYYVFSYDDLSKKFNYNIDYDVIQAVILGNMPQHISSKDKVTKGEKYYEVIQPNDPYLLECKVNTKTMKLEAVDISQQGSVNNAKINYSNFQLVEQHAFAFKALVNMIYQSGNENINTIIDIDYSKAQIEKKPLRFPFNIPKKYVRK